MKITAVKPIPITAKNRSFLFCKVETDEGIYGIGEAGFSLGLSVAEAMKHLGQLVIGQDPLSTERLWQMMFRRPFFPGDKVACSAISAIDIALWDIKGKALNLPVYKLLGGPVRDKVVCYHHTQNGLGDPAALVKNALRDVAEGWKYLRWHVFESAPNTFEPADAVRLAVKQVQEVRKAVGDDAELCLDVHTRLDPPMVIRLCKELEPYKPFFIEDPIRSENPESYRVLARHISLPIAAGEQWASKWQFRTVIEEELISYARVDLCIVGGITEALKVTHWCETHYIDLAPHNPLGPVSTAACNHLCLASTNVAVQEMTVAPMTHLPDVFPVQMPFERGYMLKPERPGLGLEFDEAAARKYDFKPGFPPEFRRPDGAFTNW
ncbi:MAG: mandelate racemase/muconate lactonizing enzyme family protein [Chloroflexota bacterium]|nr:mandelate racemase/muconate lactonizing enzyme family protein [Chloroflexota bacterium]